MLGPGRYLLGVAEILWLGGFAWLGGSALRSWLLPLFEGAPAHLASAVVALALLIWSAEALGTFGWWDPVPYLLLVAAVGLGLGKFVPQPEGEGGHPHPTQQVRVRMTPLSTLIALLIAAIAMLKFALEAKGKLSTGMTGFDSTWYHGPFAAGFAQSGDTFGIQLIAPQFLAWFYPQNSELLHGVGDVAFDRDLMSPLLNLGWLCGCLLAAWCIGRPYGAAPVSLAAVAVCLDTGAMADQAGEARNDLAAIFFVLAALAIAINAAARRDDRRLGFGPLAIVGIAAGMAAGTKVNYLAPALAIVGGM